MSGTDILNSELRCFQDVTGDYPDERRAGVWDVTQEDPAKALSLLTMLSTLPHPRLIVVVGVIWYALEDDVAVRV